MGIACVPLLPSACVLPRWRLFFHPGAMSGILLGFIVLPMSCVCVFRYGVIVKTRQTLWQSVSPFNRNIDTEL